MKHERVNTDKVSHLPSSPQFFFFSLVPFSFFPLTTDGQIRKYIFNKLLGKALKVVNVIVRGWHERRRGRGEGDAGLPFKKDCIELGIIFKRPICGSERS